MGKNDVTISKEPWLAVILSAFVSGIGQIYSARIRRGCILIVIEIFLSCLAVWLIFSLTGNIKVGVALFLLLSVIRIWNLFDAYKCAKKVNTEDFEISRKENKDPWLAVFLSDLIPGLGQIYIKRQLWGIVFIVASVLLLTVKMTYPLLFFGLWAIFSAFVCYHAYIFSPVHRETSKRLIVIVAIIILGWELSAYNYFPMKEYFVEAFKMTPSSMEPTLKSGDRMLVRKSGKYTPKRGDVIVFKSPMDPNIPWVKRVVAFESESVEIKDEKLYIDGKKLECPALQKIAYVSIGELGVEGKPFTVPKNCLFVLGDNSSNSRDSRFYGAIPETDLIGKAYKIYWPPKRMGPIK